MSIVANKIVETESYTVYEILLHTGKLISKSFGVCKENKERDEIARMVMSRLREQKGITNEAEPKENEKYFKHFAYLKVKKKW